MNNIKFSVLYICGEFRLRIRVWYKDDKYIFKYEKVYTKRR